MALKYVNEHLSCRKYANGDNVVFRFLNFYSGETVQRRYLNDTLLVFIVKGLLKIDYGTEKKLYVGEGRFFLLPKNFDIYITGIEDSEVILCTFTADIKLCSRFSLKQLDRYIPQANDGRLYCITMDERISLFIQLLKVSLKDGLGCVHYHQIKRDELFMYLRAGYTKEELAAFFFPVLSHNIDFKDFVLSHYREVRDIKEFALKANMSLSTFNRNFKSSFNETAQKWLLARKAECILDDIVMTDMPFQEISDKFGFSSPSYFVAFCKKQFNSTPNEIRKSKGKVVTDGSGTD